MGYSLAVVCKLLVAVASLVAGHGLSNVGSAVVSHGLIDPGACGV